MRPAKGLDKKVDKAAREWQEAMEAYLTDLAARLGIVRVEGSHIFDDAKAAIEKMNRAAKRELDTGSSDKAEIKKFVCRMFHVTGI